MPSRRVTAKAVETAPVATATDEQKAKESPLRVHSRSNQRRHGTRVHCTRVKRRARPVMRRIEVPHREICMKSHCKLQHPTPPSRTSKSGRESPLLVHFQNKVRTETAPERKGYRANRRHLFMRRIGSATIANCMKSHLKIECRDCAAVEK
jgi:hypothetical protein